MEGDARMTAGKEAEGAGGADPQGGAAALEPHSPVAAPMTAGRGADGKRGMAGRSGPEAIGRRPVSPDPGLGSRGVRAQRRGAATQGTAGGAPGAGSESGMGLGTDGPDHEGGLRGDGGQEGQGEGLARRKARGQGPGQAAGQGPGQAGPGDPAAEAGAVNTTVGALEAGEDGGKGGGGGGDPDAGGDGAKQPEGKREAGNGHDRPRIPGDPGDTGKETKEQAEPELRRLRRRLAELQEKLYADGRYALLVVLQGMDAAGKDGVVRHVFRGVNPQGVRVHSFKQPTPREAAQDFLWRVHQAAPPKGLIGIFNRSHYEDVLVVRVHGLVPAGVWRSRYGLINDFERLLTESGVRILKFCLHVSKDEQRRRFDRRLQDPRRHWKFSPDDLRERQHWGEYQAAYAEMLEACSTPHAPWTIVPADHKWYRNLIVARAVVAALEEMHLRYPELRVGAEG